MGSSDEKSDVESSGRFTVKCIVDENVATLRLIVSGELDVATAPDLAFELAEAWKLRPSSIVIEASELTFCDSSGIRTLIYAAHHSEECGIDLKFVGVTGSVRRTLELINVHDILRLNPE